MDRKDVKYLVFDIESVPDARLIKMVKFPGQELDDATAIANFQEEVLAVTQGASSFIPVTFQYPVSICVAKVGERFNLAEMVSLDFPRFRPGEMTRLFWDGVENSYPEASLVSFNGRGFDIPLLELMAYRYGVPIKRQLKDKFGARYRFGTRHRDLHDWLSNYNAIKMQGGLNLLAKVLGKPGKMGTSGNEVYPLFLEGKTGEINDYCIHDVLDTYFVFLRTRVMTGEITLQREQDIVKETKKFLEESVTRTPAFAKYLRNWGDWEPWP